MTEVELTTQALAETPIFPLPNAVLLPHTFISLHVFEPRYRVMMEDCLESHRLLAIAQLDDTKDPDQHQRPRIYPVAGLGVLRRSARLPDGRYNIVLEGLARIDIGDELPPTRPYRRARARILSDIYPIHNEDLNAATSSLRLLCQQALSGQENLDADVLESLAGLKDPGRLADLVAAAAIQEAEERQKVLAELDILSRVRLVSGALAEMLFQVRTEGSAWGIKPGDA